MNKPCSLARILLLGLCFLGLSACSSQESKVGSMMNLKTDIALRIDSGLSINPDHQGEASPVFIRLYELTSDEAFAGADFIELYERDKAALGDTFVQRRKLPRIAPGEIQRHELVLGSATQYVAIFAEFFQYQDATYKVVVPITSKNVFRNSIHLRISGNQISVVN